MGLLRRARVRVMLHAHALRDGRPRWSYLDGQERAVLVRLLDADDRLSVWRISAAATRAAPSSAR